MTTKEKQAAAYDILAKSMDARDHFLYRLKAFYTDHGYVPAEYEDDWEAFKRDRFKSWRQIPKARKFIYKAAKKAAKAKGLTALQQACEKELGLA